MLFIYFLFSTSCAAARSKRGAALQTNIRNTEPTIGSDGKIRYIIRYNLSGFRAREKETVRTALCQLSHHVCLDFVETRFSKSPENVILVKGPAVAKGCSTSYIGRPLDHRPVVMNLAAGCLKIGHIQHEFAHALGLAHEQVRPDRDEFLAVHWQNIISGRYHNFRKLRKTGSKIFNDLETPFDSMSLMLYDSNKFRLAKKGYTMTLRKNGVNTGNPVPDQELGISSMDVYEICKLYNCQKCAGQPVQSYQGAAYANLMEKCDGTPDQYFWKSKCYDGVRDCPNGEDENESNSKCKTECCAKVQVRGLRHDHLNTVYHQNGISVNGRPLYVDSTQQNGMWFEARIGERAEWIIGPVHWIDLTKNVYTSGRQCPTSPFVDNFRPYRWSVTCES